jgi:hypothetical protein
MHPFVLEDPRLDGEPIDEVRFVGDVEDGVFEVFSAMAALPRRRARMTPAQVDTLLEALRGGRTLADYNDYERITTLYRWNPITNVFVLEHEGAPGERWSGKCSERKLRDIFLNWRTYEAPEAFRQLMARLR